MKRLNSKGFAISTILYGLIIIVVLMMGLLMSTISFSRTNSKKLVNQIIENLEMKPLNIKIKKIIVYDNPNNIEVKNIYAGVTEDYWIVIEISGDDYQVTKRDRKSNQDIVGGLRLDDKDFQFEYGDISSDEKSDGKNTFRIHIQSPKYKVKKIQLSINKGVFITSNGNSNETVKIDLGEADFDNFNISNKMIEDDKRSVYTVSISVKRNSGIPVSDELLNKVKDNINCYADNGYNKILLNSGTEINHSNKNIDIQIKVNDYMNNFKYNTPPASILCTINGFDGSDQLMATDRLDFETGYEFCCPDGNRCKWWIQKINNIPYY